MRARSLNASVLLFSAAAFVALAPGPAQAADVKDGDRVLATELFKEGRRLLAERRYAEACRKLEESERLDPGGGTLLNLALCHELEGRTATAWSEFHEALAVARRDGRDDREEQALRHIDSLEPHLARLVIVVPEEARLADLTVLRDGSVVGSAAWGAAVPIDPGRHLIEAKAPDRVDWHTSIDIAPSGQETIQISLLEPVPSPAPPPKPANASPLLRPAPRIAHQPGSLQRVAAVILGGLGVVGVGLGTGFGIEALRQWADARPRCASGCDDQGYLLWSDAKHNATLSTLAFALGGAAIVGGGVLWLTSSSSGAFVRVGSTGGASLGTIGFKF